MSDFKEFLRSSVFTRGFYNAYRNFKSRKVRKIRKNMDLKGNDTIFFIEKTLSEHAFFYMDMGTMLGIVREGKLLGHDLDIDVAVYVEGEEGKERIKNVLLDAGCKLKYTYVVESIGIVEHSFEFNELKFDINYYVRKEDKDICYLMYNNPDKEYKPGELDVVMLTVSAVNGVKKVPFCGGEVTIPQEPEKYLEERYGDKWRIPDKNYVYWMGPSAEAVENKGYKEKGDKK